MALFADQAKDVDIIITTALIRTLKPLLVANVPAGKPAPKLLLKEHVEAMKRGFLVVPRC
jgi:NAD/NADP transhydrogenase alpha subunit